MEQVRKPGAFVQEVIPTIQDGSPSLSLSPSAELTRFRFAPSVVAVLLFLILNLLACWAFPSLFQDSFEWQNRNGCWWAVKNFRDLPEKADVLLVGSSLMCRVVNEGDATYLNHPLNALEHYRSRLMEDILAYLHASSQEGSSKIRHYRTVSLAVGGMNASDVATLVPPLLTPDKTPSAIVYGIGPRDLFDNSLESPADTAPFRLAEKMQELDEESQRNARPGREAQFKIAVNRLLNLSLPIYHYQEEFSIAFRRRLKDVMDTLIPKPAICDLPPISNIARIKLHHVAEDVKNICIVKPDDTSHPDKFDFNDNYFLSYNPFKPALYRRQLFFLNRFLKFGEEKGIKIFLVKMPLRQDNYSLMVPNFYNIYSHDIDRLAAEHGATVIDASKLASFTDKDFTDTVHLTGRGGCKLIETISPIIYRNLP